MSLLERWLTHRKTNKLYKKLLEELGPVTKKDTPELLLDEAQVLGSKFVRPEWSNSGKPEIHIPRRKSDIADSALSHEVAHSTGLLGSRGNELSKNLLGIGYGIGKSPVINAALQLSGVGGLSALAQAVLLAEEGQANVRGARALKKIQGKLSTKNKAGYGLSMGSYLIDSGVAGLLFPKAVQQWGDQISPGFAEDHPVLLDKLY